MDRSRPHIVLIGLMGSGKTTLANALAKRIGFPIRDSDRDIERLWGTTGSAVAAAHGVARLHEIERGLLLGSLAADQPTIITAAASTIDDDLCRRAMTARAYVVVLSAPIEVLLERAAGGDHRRTVDRDEFEALADSRSEFLTAVADLTVDTRLPVRDLVAAIIPLDI